jgi:hypothetical protein
MHCGVEVTESSTNKQNHHQRMGGQERGAAIVGLKEEKY